MHQILYTISKLTGLYIQSARNADKKLNSVLLRLTYCCKPATYARGYAAV